MCSNREEQGFGQQDEERVVDNTCGPAGVNEDKKVAPDSRAIRPLSTLDSEAIDLEEFTPPRENLSVSSSSDNLPDKSIDTAADARTCEPYGDKEADTGEFVEDLPASEDSPIGPIGPIGPYLKDEFTEWFPASDQGNCGIIVIVMSQEEYDSLER